MTASGGPAPGTEMASEAQTLLGGVVVIGHVPVRGLLGPHLRAPGPQGAENGRQGQGTCPPGTVTGPQGAGRPFVIGHQDVIGPAVCRGDLVLFHQADVPCQETQRGHFLVIERQRVGLDRAHGRLSLCCITVNRGRPLWRRVHAGLCLGSPLPERVRGMVGGGPVERNKIGQACTVGAAGEFLPQETL